MSKQVNSQDLADFLKPRLNARFRTWLKICANCALCADTCHFYLSHDRNPEMIPAYKVRFLNEILKGKAKIDEDYLRKMYETIYYECNMCRRCALYCPFGIDIGLMVALQRAMLHNVADIRPAGLLAAIESYKQFGNQMSLTQEDWVDTLEWTIEELEDDYPTVEIPIDKQNADILYTVNAREPKFYPQDIQEAAIIFNAVGESWTVPSVDGWDDTNLAMFCGDLGTSKMLVEKTFNQAEKLNAKKVAITE